MSTGWLFYTLNEQEKRLFYIQVFYVLSQNVSSLISYDLVFKPMI